MPDEADYPKDLSEDERIEFDYECKRLASLFPFRYPGLVAKDQPKEFDILAIDIAFQAEHLGLPSEGDDEILLSASQKELEDAWDWLIRINVAIYLGLRVAHKERPDLLTRYFDSDHTEDEPSPP